jgi:peptide methionine sulfoxide reductase msrA/msrB
MLQKFSLMQFVFHIMRLCIRFIYFSKIFPRSYDTHLHKVYKSAVLLCHMRRTIVIGLLFAAFILSSCSIYNGGNMDKKNSNSNDASDLTVYVTQQCGTEPPFKNKYWNEHRPGIYVDVNTGEPLFSSIDKFDSGTGWPSFTKPISNASIAEKPDKSLGIERIEVRTNASHLGHLFDDGPNGSMRYCINSAALKFIPYEELDSQGYGEYKKLFHYEIATFAGGCFWGVEKLLENISGVISATSGYTGGTTKNPTYEQVSSGKTGHAEAVQVLFDPSIISYKELLDYFWRLHDSTQLNQQGPDIGTNYRSAIFYHDEEQKKIAEQSKAEFDAKKIFAKPAVTEIVPASTFYPAEEYHQDYYDKHPGLTCHVLRSE